MHTAPSRYIQGHVIRICSFPRTRPQLGINPRPDKSGPFVTTPLLQVVGSALRIWTTILCGSCRSRICALILRYHVHHQIFLRLATALMGVDRVARWPAGCKMLLRSQLTVPHGMKNLEKHRAWAH
ncbi:hypothetical protein M3J09_001609 [Ascochyta lentis]